MLSKKCLLSSGDRSSEGGMGDVVGNNGRSTLLKDQTLNKILYIYVF